ncbi:hypothetical protein Avbf_08350 [Armadillidium vulgare]|nr:hypothetical protein Avbf_08350 [Armadillidium vulgare]
MNLRKKSLDASEIYIVNSATLTIQYLDFLRCFLDLYCELCHFDDTISRLSKVLKSLDASDLYCELCHFDDTISRLSKVLKSLDASEIYIVNSATLTIQYLDFLRY